MLKKKKQTNKQKSEKVSINDSLTVALRAPVNWTIFLYYKYDRI